MRERHQEWTAALLAISRQTKDAIDNVAVYRRWPRWFLNLIGRVWWRPTDVHHAAAFLQGADAIRWLWEGERRRRPSPRDPGPHPCPVSSNPSASVDVALPFQPGARSRRPVAEAVTAGRAVRFRRRLRQDPQAGGGDTEARRPEHQGA